MKATIPMAKTEEPNVTQPNREESAETILPDPKSEDLMLGKTFKTACLLNWFELVNNEENYS